MIKILHKSLLLFLVSLLMFNSGICVTNATTHHRKRSASSTHKSKKKVISTKEAGAASAVKAQLARKKRTLRTKIRHVKARIHEAKVRENQITEKIDTVEERITKTRANLNATQNRMKTLDEKHDELVSRMNATEMRLQKRRKLLAARIEDNYMRGRASYTQVLLQSRSIHELLSRGYYVRRVVESDQQLIDGVKQDLAQLKHDREEMEAQQREQQRLAEEFESRKALYVEDLEKKQQILHTVTSTRVQAEDELDEMEQESEAMTSRIRQLSDMLRMRQEALRQAALARRRSARKHSTPLPPDNEEEEIPVMHGRFIRPVNARITSGFGYRYHPILGRRRMHTGTDFGAHYGAAIHAAGDGVVILAQYNHGYGNCVIIDHGNGTTTLYGHASALLVHTGQAVHAGQVIARVGSTGLSTGAHLHFEVRRNGVPVRPPF